MDIPVPVVLQFHIIAQGQPCQDNHKVSTNWTPPLPPLGIFRALVNSEMLLSIAHHLSRSVVMGLLLDRQVCLCSLNSLDSLFTAQSSCSQEGARVDRANLYLNRLLSSPVEGGGAVPRGMDRAARPATPVNEEEEVGRNAGGPAEAGAATPDEAAAEAAAPDAPANGSITTR